MTTDLEELQRLTEAYRQARWATDQAWWNYNLTTNDFIAADGELYDFHKARIAKAAEAAGLVEADQLAAYKALDAHKAKSVIEDR